MTIEEREQIRRTLNVYDALEQNAKSVDTLVKVIEFDIARANS